VENRNLNLAKIQKANPNQNSQLVDSGNFEANTSVKNKDRINKKNVNDDKGPDLQIGLSQAPQSKHDNNKNVVKSQTSFSEDNFSNLGQTMGYVDDLVSSSNSIIKNNNKNEQVTKGHLDDLLNHNDQQLNQMQNFQIDKSLGDINKIQGRNRVANLAPDSQQKKDDDFAASQPEGQNNDIQDKFQEDISLLVVDNRNRRAQMAPDSKQKKDDDKALLEQPEGTDIVTKRDSIDQSSQEDEEIHNVVVNNNIKQPEVILRNRQAAFELNGMKVNDFSVSGLIVKKEVPNTWDSSKEYPDLKISDNVNLSKKDRNLVNKAAEFYQEYLSKSPMLVSASETDKQKLRDGLDNCDMETIRIALAKIEKANSGAPIKLENS
jgi:hypothetical protein